MVKLWLYLNDLRSIRLFHGCQNAGKFTYIKWIMGKTRATQNRAKSDLQKGNKMKNNKYHTVVTILKSNRKNNKYHTVVTILKSNRKNNIYHTVVTVLKSNRKNNKYHTVVTILNSNRKNNKYHTVVTILKSNRKNNKYHTVVTICSMFYWRCFFINSTHTWMTASFH
jgi:Trp operon repressor